ncbi:MAG: alpha/beta hydrolase [Bryobacterales bacterium]|nr:alpha/beta hydrolase [Bryobacterales bacterium]
MKHLAALLALAAVAHGAEKITDIEFARPGGFSLTLDISIPEGLGPHPLVILVHGGGWENGDKETYIQPWFPMLTRAGLAWASINYRLAPRYRFPAPVEDIESAVRFLRANANKYRVDEHKVALMGESAGGHLVAMAAARGNVKLKGVVDFYGPANLISLTEHRKQLSRNIQQFLGITEINPDTTRMMQEASPVTYASKKMPPFLLIHGDADVTVPPQQSEEFCDKLKAAKARCELFIVAGAPHGVSNWEKSEAFQGYKEKVVDWLQTVLK